MRCGYASFQWDIKMAKKPKEPEYKPSDLENQIVKVFSDTWPVSANFRAKLRPILQSLEEEMAKLKAENSKAFMAMFNILGEARVEDWSDEPTEAMIAELEAWVNKYHEMKKLLENDGFVPYSTGERGEPFMAIDEYGRGKLLLVIPTSATQMIHMHGTNAPKKEKTQDSQAT